MRLKQHVEARVRAQFHRPTGLSGRMAGWFMGHRSSNRVRNEWVVSLLGVEHDDRVLEIGFGPGLAIRELSRIAVDGYVCGIDHSEVMVRQARKRNAEAIEHGHVDLRLGSAEDLPVFEVPFDKVLAVNSLQSWDRPLDRLRDLRRALRPGGEIAIAFQPRGPRATAEAAAQRGQQIAAALSKAGFCSVRIETLPLTPPVVCALGVTPSENGAAHPATQDR